MLKSAINDLIYLVTHGYTPEKDFTPTEYFSASMDNMILSEPRELYGNRQSNSSFAEQLKKRTKLASIAVINLMEKSGKSPALNVIRYQLIKSATSTAANYRAVCRARSTKEFYAKLCIVVEECDETIFWFETLLESEIAIDKEAIRKLFPEWESILKIVVSARKSAGIKLNKPTP